MRVRIPENVVVRDLAGEAVLLHLGTGIYFGLDAVGARIWQLLAEQQSAEAVVPRLLQEFEVDEPRLRRDIETLVAQLLAEGLLVAVDESA